MKYKVKPTKKFEKDLKLAAKRGYDLNLIANIIKKLANGEKLPAKNKDHILSGKLYQ